MLLILLASCAVVLLPWTAYLGRTLPTSHQVDGWRVAWVGFDVGLMILLLGALWLGRRRHRMAVAVMTATAALLVCDAWFDLVLDWDSSQVWLSGAMALLVEIPLAAVLFISGQQLLSGGMARHTMTAEDVRLQSDPDTAKVMDALADGPVSAETVVATTGLPPAIVAGTLHGLRRSRLVRRGRDGRWSAVPISLVRPVSASLSPEDREAVDAFYDQKLRRDLQLFEWAADHHLEFAEWAKGSRSGMWLTERELVRFDHEYLELVMRYSQLHAAPTARTREVAVRWYAFPTREDHERATAPG